jgi:type IV fimbrial biogenesis protein FimT
VELVTVLAVVAVLIAAAGPGYRNLIMNNRLVAQMNGFATTVNFARSEAIKRGIAVTLCKSADGASCGDSAVMWEQGWIVFPDPNADGVVDAGETVLRVAATLGGGNTLRSGMQTRITLRPDGFLSVPPLGTDTWRLCDARGAKDARAVIVYNTGRAESRSPVSGAVVRDHTGASVSCP